MKEYSKGIYVKFKPEEVEILHDRMKEAGVQNMSAYIRKMALNGYVIIPEWPDLNRVISLHTRISNNLNQYAKKANETGKLYEEDIAEIKMMNNEQTELLKKALERISIMIKNKVVIKERDAWSDLANFIGEMVAKYADAMELDQLPDPDNYLRMKRIKQLYMELYKTENIEKFRSIIISIERNAAA